MKHKVFYYISLVTKLRSVLNIYFLQDFEQSLSPEEEYVDIINLFSFSFIHFLWSSRLNILQFYKKTIKIYYNIKLHSIIFLGMCNYCLQKESWMAYLWMPRAMQKLLIVIDT